MTGRYQNAAKVRKDGRLTLRSTLYPSIPRSLDDIYVLTSAGDRLDLLAHKYYGSVSYAWVIATANGIGLGTHHIEPGSQIRIPANLSQILTDLENLNS